MTYRVTLSHDPAALAQLGPAWEKLQAQSYAWCVFNTWDWASTWWEHFGARGELWLLLAYDASEELAGIAPLMLTRASRLPGFAWRQLQFLSSGMHNDHLDFIIREGTESEVIPAFLEVLRQQRQRWDVLRLENIVETSPTLAVLRASGLPWKTERSEPAPFISLPADWEEYFGGLSYLKRKRQRRMMRKVEKDFAGRWSAGYVTQREEVDAAFETLVQLHQAKWEGTDQPGAFGDPQVRAFYADIARRFVENGRLRLYRLYLNGEVAAAFFGFRYRDRHFDLVSGIHYQFADWDPGHILTECVLREAFETGLLEYDFLLGNEEYKYKWGAVNRFDHTLVWHQSLAARAQEGLYQALRWLKSQLRRGRRANQTTAQPSHAESSAEDSAQE